MSIVVRVWVGVVVPEEVRVGVSLVVAAGMAGWVFFRGGALLALNLGLLWLTLFGPATEVNTYSVLAPVAGVLCVIGRWQWLSRFGTVLLLVGVIRGGFPPGLSHPLHEVQAIGAGLLLAAALKPFEVEDRG